MPKIGEKTVRAKEYEISIQRTRKNVVFRSIIMVGTAIRREVEFTTERKEPRLEVRITLSPYFIWTLQKLPNLAMISEMLSM